MIRIEVNAAGLKSLIFRFFFIIIERNQISFSKKGLPMTKMLAAAADALVFAASQVGSQFTK